MKHWINAPECPCMFVTSTVRDWMPVFDRDEIREALTASILDDHRHYGALVFAFVTMRHHFHTVSIMPPGKSSAWFADRVKSNSAKRILPLLSARERRMLDEAKDEDGRVLWKRSFRGVPITSTGVRITKVNYVHWNPVRAGICEFPQDYRWSSYWLREAGHWHHELGLDLEFALREFGPPPPFPG